tara:strand:+ start:211256 stop:211954 length:699 start_codon:yes stop_codon:yes gene_type:complete
METIAQPLQNRSLDCCPTAHFDGPVRGSRHTLDVHFFLDFSNIAISASNIAVENGDGLFDQQLVRIHAGNLRQIAQRNRCWGSGFAAAGLVDQQSRIKNAFEKEGVSFEICERGRITNREQYVDQRIQLQMHRLLRRPVERGVVVLATGDGNRTADSDGFIETLATLNEYGFRIEVMSWRDSMNSNLRSWASRFGRFIELDDFYRDLTFVVGGRCATPQHELGSKLIRKGII